MLGLQLFWRHVEGNNASGALASKRCINPACRRHQLSHCRKRATVRKKSEISLTPWNANNLRHFRVAAFPPKSATDRDTAASVRGRKAQPGSRDLAFRR
jgi:hypothetical protein